MTVNRQEVSLKVAIFITVSCLLSASAFSQTTTMKHKDGSTTTVKSDKSNTTVETTAKGAKTPSGSETNAGSHKENTQRVKQEGNDKGNPVTKSTSTK